MSWHTDVPSLLTRLRRRLTRRGRLPEDAEDLIQEAFLKLEQYCRRGKQVDCPEAFLSHAVKNLSVSQFRAEHRYVNGRVELDGELLRDPAPTPEEIFAAQQRLEQIAKLLPARTREVYFMHKFGGLGYVEIAERLNCSISLVEKILAAAVTKLVQERQSGRLREGP
ncbi:RNA polymerase sigma factor [Steroidobacter sp.]|uniref:RNA polymerase sigma factor n=1 Tax=Steroidobacter sp. TaxID=1978227 RepID=UPI001A57C196|nr:sigma-70 family RNA polymerase sigma factor [Steroidobacter sp.]MBL8265672.1 sigma-70 family RNA polymerase sigma factor [Steroidobacter sp.]